VTAFDFPPFRWPHSDFGEEYGYYTRTQEKNHSHFYLKQEMEVTVILIKIVVIVPLLHTLKHDCSCFFLFPQKKKKTKAFVSRIQQRLFTQLDVGLPNEMYTTTQMSWAKLQEMEHVSLLQQAFFFSAHNQM
jgi:hypothetical protein